MMDTTLNSSYEHGSIWPIILGVLFLVSLFGFAGYDVFCIDEITDYRCSVCCMEYEQHGGFVNLYEGGYCRNSNCSGKLVRTGIRRVKK